MKLLTLNQKKQITEAEIAKNQKQIEKNQSKEEQNKKKLVILEELEEIERDDMEQFDDYMEMVVTFGYITMFASVFTLGATCIFIFILLETRSDLFKLEKTMKRPIPEKTHHIGSWTVIIEIFCFLAVFSNIIITCYASDQIDYLLPWMKDLKSNDSVSIFTIFILEHILLMTVFSLKVFLDHKPGWVLKFEARRHIKQEQDQLRRISTISSAVSTK